MKPYSIVHFASNRYIRIKGKLHDLINSVLFTGAGFHTSVTIAGIALGNLKKSYTYENTLFMILLQFEPFCQIYTLT